MDVFLMYSPMIIVVNGHSDEERAISEHLLTISINNYYVFDGP